VLAGNLLKWVGFDAGIAAQSGVPQEVLSTLKVTFVTGQAAVVLLGLVLISLYPITRTRAMETQRRLKERRGEI